MYDKQIEHLKRDEIVYAELDEEKNKVIVETAGFVPLDIKFKRFEENGIMAQFHSSEFTSSDLRELYSIPDFDILPEDDIEDIIEKMEGRRNYMMSMLNRVKTAEVSKGNTAVAPQADNKQSEKQEKSESNVDKQ